jgi:D-alanyl-D-alanine carboxypeptidase (penicillin-binding protein 5/6)
MTYPSIYTQVLSVFSQLKSNMPDRLLPIEGEGRVGVSWKTCTFSLKRYCTIIFMKPKGQLLRDIPTLPSPSMGRSLSVSLPLKLTGFVLLFSVFATSAQAFNPEDLKVKQAYAVDYDTGAVLFAKNEHERMPTSSMSKVMTMYLVFEALKEGRLKLDDTFPVSEKAWKMQGSKMFVPIGANVRVEDLIRGVIIQSGNDATIVLAEGLAGSEEAFAVRMNEKAAELGMKDSHFVNASGWPDPDHYSTAHDLTLLGRALVQNFPEYYKYYAETEYTYNKIKQGNRNPLLYKSMGADGIKTGHTDAAGYGLIGSGFRDGRRVVFTMNGMDSMQARADETTKMMGWALGSFVNLSPFPNERSVTSASVVLGQAPTVPLALGDTFNVTVPRVGGRQMVVRAEYKDPLIAPIAKGTEVGTLYVQIDPEQPAVKLPLVTAADVPAMGLIPRTMVKAIYGITGKGLVDE